MNPRRLVNIFILSIIPAIVVFSAILIIVVPIAFAGPAAFAEELRAAGCYPGNSGNPELRGMWINVKSIPLTPEGIRALVRRLYDSNFNAIFPEVFYQGSTIFFSKTLESRGLTPQMPAFIGFDPLEVLIEEAHKYSMEVHAWFTMFYVGLNSPGPILTKYPEWAAVNKDGGTGYQQGANRFYWVCPMHPGVSDFYGELIGELAERYDVDGIHLDYIRYPDPAIVDTCYSREHRREFEGLYGIDPLYLDPDLNPDEYRLWNEFRADYLNRLVKLLSEKVRRVRPEVEISCAVMPRGMPIELNPGFLQDWPLWARERYLDALIPMAYSSRVDEMRGLLGWTRHFLQDAVPMYAGLQGFNLSGPQVLVDQIEAARRYGASGVVVFAYPYMTDEYLEALRLGPFTDKVPARDIGIRCSKVRPGNARISKMDNDKRMPSTYFHKAPRRVAARYAGISPVIDGILDDSGWARADWQGDFELITGEGKAAQQTRIAVLYDRENLYIAFDVGDSLIELATASVVKRDGPVFYDDSIEVFLDPKHNHSFYYHFAVNVLGTQYDSYSRRGASWDAHWKAGVRKSEEGWSVELAIPFLEIGAPPPSSGTTWGVNFNRTVPRLGEFSGWSYTPGTFHAPSFFGDLVFDLFL